MKLQLSYPTRNIALGASALALLLLSLGTASAAPISNPATYPLDTCIVSGEVLGEHGDIATEEYDGREVRFCCKTCVKGFEKDQNSYLQKLDQAIIRAQLPNYPLQTCVVSGEALGGAMGDPVNYVVGNPMVRLCCNSCKRNHDAEPAKYLEKLDAAVVEAQLDDYPADACPVSGQKLGTMGDPYDYVFAGHLVRFCCAGCVGQFSENPTAAMTTIDGDEKAARADDYDDHSGHQH
jgi:YHS domain-containing protein